MLSPYKIKWLDYTSLEFDCLTELSFDGSDGESETFLNRESVAVESYDGRTNRVHSYKYTDKAQPKITLTKQDYTDFTPEENRAILSWLTKSNTANWLSVYADDSEVISWELCGNFIEIQAYKMGNGRIVGYTATFEGNTPYVLSPIRSITKTIETSETFNIKCETDDYNTLVYPRILIIPDGASDISIDNSAIGVTTTINNNINGEKIVADGANRIISSDRLNRLFNTDFNWTWVPLKYGNNSITVTGNCTINFMFREPIKCGEFMGGW